MRRAGRWALRAAGALTLLGVAAGLAGTAPVLTWLAARAGWQLEGAQGSVWTGLDIAKVQQQSATLKVDAEALQWAPWRWREGALHGGLSAQRLRVNAAPSTGPALTPEQLLRMLDWPFPVAIDHLRLGELQVQGLTFQRIDASLQAGGQAPALAVQLRHLAWPDGQLSLGADLTLTRDAQLRAGLELQGPRAKVRAQGLGPVARWPVQVTLTGADGAQAELSATLQPLANQPLLGLNARLAQLDLQALHPQAPRTRWSGTAGVAPRDSGEFDLSLEARNALALRLDEGGWPLRELSLRLHVHPAHWQGLRVDALRLQLGNAAEAAGELSLTQSTALPNAGQALALPIRVQGVQLPRLDASWPALQLDGRLQLSQAQAQAPLGLQADLQTRALNPGAQAQAWRLSAQAELQGQTLTLNASELQQIAGPGRVQLTGRWTGQAQGWSAQGSASVTQWPLRWGHWAGVAQAQAEARLGWQAGTWQGQAKLSVDEGARLAELPVQGALGWTADAQGQRWNADLRLPHAQGDTNLHAEAATQQPLRDLAVLGQAASWRPQQLQWQAPALERLQALWHPWLQRLSGSTQGQAILDGDGWPLSLQAQAQQWRWQPLASPAGTRGPAGQLAEARIELDADNASWRLSGLQAFGWQVREAQGSGGRKRPWAAWAEGQAPGTWDGEPLPPWRGELAAEPPVLQGGIWRLPGLSLRLAPTVGSPWLRWTAAQLAWNPGASSLQLDGGQLALRDAPMARQSISLHWRGPEPELALQLDGRVLPAPWLAALQPDAGWQGDLVTELNLALQGRALDLRLARVSGDLRLDGQTLGLDKLQLALAHSSQGQASALLDVGSPVLGSLLMQARSEGAAGGGAGGALTGQLRARLPALHLLQAWLPNGLQLRGQAQVDAQLSGTLAQPKLQGQGDLQIERLQHATSGLGGRNGRVRWRFDEQRLSLQELALQGLGEGDTGGWLRGQGDWGWGASQTGARLSLQAEGFRLLNRFDRQLVTSGEVSLALAEHRLQLRGKVQADQGVFDISQGDAPSLDDDVTIVRPSSTPVAKAAPSRWQRDVNLQFDLGQRLRVQGRGLASRLTGQLQLLEQGGKPAQWTGLVELGGGRYKAYGQNLDIESGALRFTGALDNPRLDILALRPDLEVRVGVRASGSAQTPRIRLYSEPDMPDNDKLAWLLLGRAPDELGRNDTALLQRAALALLSGEGDNHATQLLDKLGLTEFSINNSDDAGTTLRLGAQLSRRWSVGYERSLNAATGSWQLVYRLGQRFRLRAQSGTDSALDALWLWRFD